MAVRRIREEMKDTARDRSTEETKITKVLREVQHEVDEQKKKARTEVEDEARCTANAAQDMQMRTYQAAKSVEEEKQKVMLLTIQKHKDEAVQKRNEILNRAY